MFSDVNLRPTSGGNHTFSFEDRWSKTKLGPQDVSDGTMLVLAYLLAQHQEDQVDLIAIEEPERGLHPYLLGELVKVFRGMATGKLGKPVQIVVATHSAELLEFVEPAEVRFVSRDASSGDVAVETAREDTPSWQAAFREYNGSLGSLWLSGGLGGVPGG
jgi:predicted ATPase